MARNANTPITFDMPARGYGSSMQVSDGTLTTPATAVAINSTFTMCVIPRGMRIIGLIYKTDQVDSSGTPTASITIGDSGNAARYLATNTTLRTAGGGQVTTIALAGLNFVTTADTPIVLTFTAAAATQVAGSQQYLAMLYVEA